PRLFTDDGDVGVAQLPAALANQRRHPAQQYIPCRTLPLRIRRREVAPDVAQRQRAEHRVAQRMDGDVAIAVRDHATRVRHAHAAEHHVVAVAEGVDVETMADSQVHPRDPVGAAEAATKRRYRKYSRSAIVVTLKLSSLPSTSSGRWPCRSMAMDSSVTSMPASRADCSARVSCRRRNS